ncbi:MAG: glycosyltransferase family 2 protein [Bacteroidetes bacterium]|nr:glycosyltransferase family 2 protein [Bacteroidota bacterium]
MSDVYFSIITPTYNRAHLIGRTIESVIQQSFTDWELIIIDDGSTDNTKEVVSKYVDTRLKYFWQENLERSAARNNGIEKATGEFICFLDSDDIWRSHHLETLNQAIGQNQNKPGLYFTGMCWNFPDRKQDVVFENPKGENPVEYVITNQIGVPCTCINRVIFDKYKFNTTLKINEDVELFARIVSEYPLMQIPIVTVDVLIHGENTKAQEQDYITPQIIATRLIFNNDSLKNRISVSFKRNRLCNLRHQLINHYYNTGLYYKMNLEIIRFLILYPLDPRNKSKLVLLLYHLPGGNILKSIIRKLK